MRVLRAIECASSNGDACEWPRISTDGSGTCSSLKAPLSRIFPPQLYSTASYQAHDLIGIGLGNNNLPIVPEPAGALLALATLLAAIVNGRSWRHEPACGPAPGYVGLAENGVAARS
jgi:hypothetical protein